MIGIDFYKTITKNPYLFRKIAKAHMDAGTSVYVISAVTAKNVEKLKREFKAARIPCTRLETVVFEDYEDIAKLKLKACKRIGVKMMYDDMDSVVELLSKNGILTFQVK